MYFECIYCFFIIYFFDDIKYFFDTYSLRNIEDNRMKKFQIFMDIKKTFSLIGKFRLDFDVSNPMNVFSFFCFYFKVYNISDIKIFFSCFRLFLCFDTSKIIRKNIIENIFFSNADFLEYNAFRFKD